MPERRRGAEIVELFPGRKLSMVTNMSHTDVTPEAQRLSLRLSGISDALAFGDLHPDQLWPVLDDIYQQIQGAAHKRLISNSEKTILEGWITSWYLLPNILKRGSD